MTTWLEDTQELLASAPRWLSLSQIAQDTGLQVSWLSAFATHKVQNPGITKVQVLHDYLSVVPRHIRPERIKYGEHKTYADTATCRAGIYVIWSDKTCVYVGNSGDMFKRLDDHWLENRIKLHNPTHVDLIYTGEKTEFDMRRHELQHIKIRALAPLENSRSSG